jgi:hypothetical protein
MTHNGMHTTQVVCVNILRLTDVESVLGSLHRVDVGSIPDVSEVHPASIFRVAMHADAHVLPTQVYNY